MEIREIIGIDVSKLTLDCCIHSNGQQIVIANTPESIAKRIALYGYRLRSELIPSKMVGESISNLKRLMSLRKKLVRQRAGHIACVGEQKRVLDGFDDSLLYEAQRAIINTLDKQISNIEIEQERIVSNDPELQRLYKLLLSIKGVGPVTAKFLIVYTAGFTSFESWRKFASYSGIAPFPNRSGTSVRGRTKTSNLANKEAKTLLNLCAFTAIQWNPEMKAYYNRRIGEGKSKMSTMNIIRNKILARAFAVVQRGTPYVDTMKYAS